MMSAPSLRSSCDDRLWCEAMPGAVHVAAELHALLVECPQGLQGEHLKSARVGEDRARPSHERVQAAEGPDQFRPRAQMEVIGVGQQHLDPGGAQLARIQRLDRPHRADWHERRRLDDAVWGREHTGAGAARGGNHRKGEVGRHQMIAIASPYE